MGDCFQFVAATEVTESDAPAKGTELLEWLIREEIVLPEPNHEYVHSKSPGYAPGPRYADACESTGRESLLNTNPNTLAIITIRTIYYNCPGDLDVPCAACDTNFSDDEMWNRYTDVLGDLYDHGTIGTLKCPKCETERSILEWQRDGPMVIANLGLEIWNWPPLSKEFLARIERIIGSEVRYLFGKL